MLSDLNETKIRFERSSNVHVRGVTYGCYTYVNFVTNVFLNSHFCVINIVISKCLKLNRLIT